MIIFKVHNEAENSISTFYKTPEGIAEHLVDSKLADWDDAIDAESWCELAYYEDVYEGEGFHITMEDV